MIRKFITYQLVACLQLKSLTWKFQLDQAQQSTLKNPWSLEMWNLYNKPPVSQQIFPADFLSNTESARPKENISGPLWETPWEKITSHQWNVWIFCKFPFPIKPTTCFFHENQKRKASLQDWVKLPLNSHKRPCLFHAPLQATCSYLYCRKIETSMVTAKNTVLAKVAIFHT